ncbi:divalent-cation tolerance protein CutA [Vibrio ziniensis]|uniref:Divalent-cation tolerance protein CutA n=1 Tax=Vibrio ziniensis TaxID=2711221 RepID=A0A6G7CPW5_9VIBR|nr:divalent-cation tolerance protein CutA [Vibrio ziniensis]QIH44132.1 divalent-cation tolerance protein CutA [Vibrio ziniensis]
MNDKFCIVLTTTNSQEVTQQLIRNLLSNQLAACIQTLPINSHYIWEGEVCNDEEILLVIKTQAHLFSQIEGVIEQIHNYEVPQLVQVPITDGFNPYLKWIEANTL